MQPGATWQIAARLPAGVLIEAAQQDAVRLGAYGSAWFAHSPDGEVTHVEIRSPTFKGSLKGGRKTLFRFGYPMKSFTRLAVLEAPIDALSLAAIERIRQDTLYVATGGGMGPGTLEALQQAVARLAPMAGVLVSAADANAAGDRFAARHEELAAHRRNRFRATAAARGQRLEQCACEGEGSMTPARAWVRLQSGHRLDLLEPDPNSWTDSDLAIGLSRTYRWGGHSCWDLPLSVAQHSLLVLVLRQKLRPLEPLTRGEALRELLHDADEGLLSYDPISPVKPHLGADFHALAGRMQIAVQTRYGLLPWDDESYAVHKQADRLAAASEALHVAGWSLWRSP